VKEETVKAVVVADSGNAPCLSEVLMKWDMAQGTASNDAHHAGSRGAVMKICPVEEKVLTTRGSGG
jgi:hypothetical protein